MKRNSASWMTSARVWAGRSPSGSRSRTSRQRKCPMPWRKEYSMELISPHTYDYSRIRIKMELERILLKIIANEELTAYEQSFLLDFFAALQRQNVTKLSDISFNAGDLVAGRFIAPAPTALRAEPTDTGFTGSFMSASGETFGGTVYNIGGALLGVLQWGASQETGKLIAGAGGVVIDENGIVIENSSGNIFFKDTTGVYDAT